MFAGMSDLERKFELAKLDEDEQLDGISKILEGLKEKSKVRAFFFLNLLSPSHYMHLVE
jgi:hypothetical protein